MSGDVSSQENSTNAVSIPKVAEAFTLAIGIISVLFNGVLLFVMTVNSRQIFASLGSYFIANLAVADFITGVNSICWGINGFRPFNPDIKKAFLFTFWVTVQVSFFTIFVMSTERLIAIVFPFRAALLMSRKKTLFYCGAVWFVAIVCAGLMNVKEQPVWFVLTVIFEIVIMIIVIEYVFVFRQLRALWRHSKKRVVYTHEHQAICSPDKRTSDLQREYQATIVVVTLAVILILTVFPYMVLTQIILGCRLFHHSCKVEEALNSFMWYYFPIELLNFALNPVVYAWRLPKYRKAFQRTLGLGKSRYGCPRFNSDGSPETVRSTCPNEKQIALLNCKSSLNNLKGGDGEKVTHYCAI